MNAVAKWKSPVKSWRTTNSKKICECCRFQSPSFDYWENITPVTATTAETSLFRESFDLMTSLTNTIKLHRILRAPTDRVYRAFLDADAMVKWIPPHGFTGKMHEIDVRVGGGYRMSFTNFSTGKSHSFGGTYLELSPGERIRYSDKFDDPNLPGEMQVTISLKKVLCGTEIEILQEGVPAAIPAEFCYAGWQESLQLLALLIEAEIPDEP